MRELSMAKKRLNGIEMAKHVTIDNIIDWGGRLADCDGSMILDQLADTIADLLNGTFTIAQLRKHILSCVSEPPPDSKSDESDDEWIPVIINGADIIPKW